MIDFSFIFTDPKYSVVEWFIYAILVFTIFLIIRLTLFMLIETCISFFNGNKDDNDG